MEDLLPHYERELAFLRGHSREFAERYPKVAGRLLLSGEGCDDPHVERMIESFAFLSARVSRKLEDSYPKFTEALLNVLYPHYLRPFPACSIAHFDSGAGTRAVIPRGTELHSRPVEGITCRFRTAWSVNVLPARIAEFRFEATARVPVGVSVPRNSNGILSLRVLLPEVAPTQGAHAPLRLYIDAETSVASTLRDALFLRCAMVWVENDDVGPHVLEQSPVVEVGFDAAEGLIDFPDNSHDAYRHLTEYFAFPEKYNFLDLVLDRLPPRMRTGREIRVHFVLGDHLTSKGYADQLLSTVSASTLKLGCVPVVNLFTRRGEPIRATGRSARYPVVADARQPHGYEVYSIDSVRRLRKGSEGESATQFRPFFSLKHGETRVRDGHYWFAERDEQVAARNPGYEVALTVVEPDFEPFESRTDVLSVDLSCTNRNLPQMLAIGQEGGDLFMEGGSPVRAIRLLRKPTASCRLDQAGEGQWRLVSHLSLNHLSLTASGTPAFREMLSLYDTRQSAVSRRQISSIQKVEQREKTRWTTGRPFACFTRGVEVRVTVDEEGFVGTGLHLFGAVVDRFLGLYVHLNSFVQLVLVSGRTGEELLRCEPRSGDSILL